MRNIEVNDHYVFSTNMNVVNASGNGNMYVGVICGVLLFIYLFVFKEQYTMKFENIVMTSRDGCNKSFDY